MLRYSLYLLFLALSASGQTGLSPFYGAESYAKGQIGLLHTSAFLSLNNPAALPFGPGLSVSAQQMVRPQLASLNRFSLAGHKKMRQQALGFGLSHFGDEYYQEQGFYLSYGLQVHRALGLGAQMLLERHFIIEGETLWLPHANFYLLWRLSEKEQLALALYQPVALSPQTRPGGARMAWSKNFKGLTLSAMLSAPWQEALNYHLGVQYQISPQLTLALGLVKSYQTSLTGGLSYRHKGFSFHLAYQSADLLGPSWISSQSWQP